MNDDAVVQAAARVLAKATLELFAADTHNWSDRPCATCRAISGVLGEPWGCYKYQAEGGKGVARGRF